MADPLSRSLSIRLDHCTYQALRLLARRQGSSQAALSRQAIQELLNTTSSPSQSQPVSSTANHPPSTNHD